MDRAALRPRLLHSVTAHSVRIKLARRLAARQQVVDVGQAFACGQAQQVAIVVDRPGAQRAEHIDCALGDVGQALAQPLQAAVMAMGQAVQPVVQTTKGLHMRWEHQQVVDQRAAQVLDAREPLAQRVSMRFGGEHAHVGRDARQHLIAGDQHAQLIAPQASMLGRMHSTDDDAPVARADAHGLPVAEAPNRQRSTGARQRAPRASWCRCRRWPSLGRARPGRPAPTG